MKPDRRSPEAQEWRKWYSTARWRRIREKQRRDESLCRMCLAAGITTPMDICDHVEPHKGDPVKFWRGPFQSLCKRHHDAAKQREERMGYSGAADDTGWPTDPRHPANRAP